MALSGREKATIFLSVLGPELSARILRHLPEELADLIAAGINHLPAPPPSSIENIMDEFSDFIALPEPKPESLQLEAPRVEPQAENPEIEEMPISSDDASPLNILVNSPARQVAALLMYERPQVSAAILSLFPPTKSLDILLNLPTLRPQIEELLRNRIDNNISLKLKDKLVEILAKKIG